MRVIFCIVLATCDAAANSCCEVISYNADRIALSIPEGYYFVPRSANGTISLMVRYRDLAAPVRFDEGYDPSELADPTWTIDHSNFTGLVQIYRIKLKRPSSAADLRQSYPNLADVKSDWAGWTKLKECSSNCRQVFYTSETWHSEGVDNVLCYEVNNEDQLRLRCTVNDNIAGLLVHFSLPATKKEQFAEVRERVVGFMRGLIANGAVSCAAAQ